MYTYTHVNVYACTQRGRLKFPRRQKSWPLERKPFLQKK